jgi:hypothetical protein
MKKKHRKSSIYRMINRNHNSNLGIRSRISPLRNIIKYRTKVPELCSDCKDVGYCRIASYSNTPPIRKLVDDEMQGSRLISYNISKLSGLVGNNNFSTGRGLFSAKHIHLANEAFCAKEYRTAHFHFKEVANELWDEEALLGIAITLFYMERYTESVEALRKCNELFLPEGMAETFAEAAALRQKLQEINESTYGKSEQQLTRKEAVENLKLDTEKVLL